MNNALENQGSRAAGRTPRRAYVIAGLASMMGTTIEWYDFFHYGTAAALIFNKIFFPSFDPLSGTLAAFATYAVGFFARPLGGIVFGHFGDRIGRKSMLIVTLFLMGVPTILIGLIPSYESIGYWAAVLLVLMRVLQGLAVGGEWGGAVLMAVEHAPEGNKGFFGSLPQAGVASGLILSSLAMTAVARLSESDMLAWGWRLPFIASVVLLGVGWFIRLNVAESPDFKRLENSGEKVKVPVAVVCRKHLPELLFVLGARLAEVTWFYTIASFSLAYATTSLNVAKTTMLNATIWGAAVVLFTIPLFGWVGDRIGQCRMFVLGALGILLCGPVFFELLGTREPALINVAMVLALGLVYGLLYRTAFLEPVSCRGPLHGDISGRAIVGGSRWRTRTHYRHLSLGGDPKFVVAYVGLLGVIGALCTWKMRETAWGRWTFGTHHHRDIAELVQSLSLASSPGANRERITGKMKLIEL
jgi:MFS family permease